MIDVQGDPRRINEMRQAVQNDDSMTLADKITNVFERLSRMEGVSASEMTELSRLKDNLLDSMRNVTDGIYSTMSWYEEAIGADESDYMTMV